LTRSESTWGSALTTRISADMTRLPRFLQRERHSSIR
jgi:hypothetical protein